jgi:predicted DNA-binding transcriptional regulator AlpA
MTYARNTSRLLTARELAGMLGTSTAALYSARYRGDDLPPAVALGPKRLRWREADVLAWLETRQEAARGAR